MARNGDFQGEVTRRGLLTGAGALSLGAALPAWAKTTKAKPAKRPAPPGPQSLADLLAAAPAGAVTGFAVLDASTGAVLEAQGETRQLPPASVQKTITSLYALEHLGGDHRLVTRVLVTGPVQGGVVQGDLILQGGGDPTLDTDTLGDLVASLRARGLKGVTGRYVYDASALPAFDRIAADQPEQAGYNPGLSGLQLNFNRVDFEWTRAAGTLAMSAKGERYLAPVHVMTMAAVDRASPLFARSDAGGVEAWSVAAPALVKDGSRWLPVRHVAPYVADVFRGLCTAQGISLPQPVAGVVPAGATSLGYRQSDELNLVLKGMLKYSTNITAETMGLLSSGAADLPGSAAAMQAWALTRLGLTATFVDHSGLGSAARITPLGLAQALRAGVATPTGAGLRGLLKSGTLDEASGGKVTVRVKSGTLNFVSGLAGFIEGAGKRDMVFAIHTADLARRAAVPVDQAEEPPGLHGWLGRAHGLQGGLIRRWAAVYGA